MAEEQEPDSRGEDDFQAFLTGMEKFSDAYTGAIVSYFEQDNRPETDYVRLQMDTVITVFRSVGKELRFGFGEAEIETHALIARHVQNSGAVNMLSSSTTLFRRAGALGFLDKIVPILEIVKKLINQIIELFPNFLENILKRIILPLLEILDNILPMILELFSGGAGARLMLKAEEHFLEAHPKWRALYFNTQAPGTNFS
ncbi:MAG: hypothetical protein ABR601_04695 [Parasphingopyxis sp.]|nr:hypothetical protein [Sphingomonadales bacterium]